MKKLKINHKSGVPLHLQVEELLRELIQQPEYQEGKFLPKEVDMANQLGISRNTIRQATNKLVYEGLLIRKKGVGTKVAHSQVNTRLDDWVSFTKEMRKKGLEVINYKIKVAWQKPDEAIASAFEIPEETEVLKVTRLRGTDEGPSLVSESYLHPRIGLTGEEDFNKPLYELLEENFSILVAISKEEISARIANKELADLLEIEEGDPVLHRKRLVCDPGGRPIEYNIVQYRADSFTYSIEIERH
ncbi:GntR family transcriptional regulator [Rapidithrix thailandica]|uniref:GntR family transcriptional regulator n=1 Tax=Rapidithrix thailandica TaxID=413964 RepID=A0AAW9S3E1_9BACT